MSDGSRSSKKWAELEKSRRQRDFKEYRCWYDLLQRSDRSRWTADVQRVFGTKDGLPFAQWYKKMAPYFDGPDEYVTLVDVDDLDEFNQLSNDPSFLVIGIHIHAHRTSIVRDIELLLRKSHRKAGRPKRDDMATVGRAGYPDLNAIYRHLAAYDAVQNNSAKLTLWQLAEKLLERTQPDHEFLEPEIDLDPDALRPSSVRRMALASFISRHIKKAKILIRGVERGVFPAHSDQTPPPWHVRWMN